MWKPYQLIRSSEALEFYEPRWKEEATKKANTSFDAFEPCQTSTMKLRDIWPQYAYVKLIVQGKSKGPMKVYEGMSNSRMAETESVLQYMEWNVLNVSILSQEDNLSITDIKIEVIKPGYRIGDPIQA